MGAHDVERVLLHLVGHFTLNVLVDEGRGTILLHGACFVQTFHLDH
jgi:hypothetical protein